MLAYDESTRFALGKDGQMQRTTGIRWITMDHSIIQHCRKKTLSVVTLVREQVESISMTLIGKIGALEGHQIQNGFARNSKVSEKHWRCFGVMLRTLMFLRSLSSSGGVLSVS